MGGLAAIPGEVLASPGGRRLPTPGSVVEVPRNGPAQAHEVYQRVPHGSKVQAPARAAARDRVCAGAHYRGGMSGLRSGLSAGAGIPPSRSRR